MLNDCGRLRLYRIYINSLYFIFAGVCASVYSCNRLWKPTHTIYIFICCPAVYIEVFCFFDFDCLSILLILALFFSLPIYRIAYAISQRGIFWLSYSFAHYGNIDCSVIRNVMTETIRNRNNSKKKQKKGINSWEENKDAHTVIWSYSYYSK